LKTNRTEGLTQVRSASADPSDAPATLFGVVGEDDPSATEKPTPIPELNGAGEPTPAVPLVATVSAPPPDPFDPMRLRLSQRSVTSVGLRKRLTTVPVRKPSREWFVRCHPTGEYRLETPVVELKEDRETYLVNSELWDLLAEEATFSPRMLSLTVTRSGTPFLWPVRLPGPDGRIDSWNGSALEAVATAETSWVRVSANMQLGAYDVIESTAIVDEPVWPTEPMAEILKVAFRGKLIDSIDHPVLRRLRGEV
jgi:hypothetical protein